MTPRAFDAIWAELDQLHRRGRHETRGRHERPNVRIRYVEISPDTRAWDRAIRWVTAKPVTWGTRPGRIG